MTTLETTNTLSTGFLMGRINAMTNNLFTAAHNWNSARVTRKVLNNLTVRQLEDIGLTRGDIDTVVRF